MKKRCIFPKHILLAAAFSMLLGVLTGCVAKVEETGKLKDLEFTVVKEEDIPEEMQAMIEEQKVDAFQGTYEDRGYLYIVEGYGVQPTTGYSVEVTAVYETENAVAVATTLLGPPKDEKFLEKETYPYVVIKLEAIDKEVQWR